MDIREIDYEGERSPGWEQQMENEKDQERWLAECKRLRDYFERLNDWVKEQDDVSEVR